MIALSSTRVCETLFGHGAWYVAFFGELVLIEVDEEQEENTKAVESIGCCICGVVRITRNCYYVCRHAFILPMGRCDGCDAIGEAGIIC